MNYPLISICIPAYTRPLYLKRLLESITIQTFKDYEIIITDDSPDDSVKNLAEIFSSTGLPITYIKNNPAAGSPANWNIAIQQAKCEWIKLMHDDDWFAQPDTLKKFVDAALVSGSNFIFSACNNIYTSGKKINEFLNGWRKEMLEENTLNLFYLNVIGHPSTIMHHKDSAVLYDEHYRWVVDIDFYIRYLQKNPGYHYIHEMLVNIGTDNTQLSYSLYKNPYIEIPEYLSLLAKFPPELYLKHEYVFHCIWNLVKRFKIKNIEMLRDYGYSDSLPLQIQSVIDFQKSIPYFILKQTNWSRVLMKRCYKKITQGLYK